MSVRALGVNTKGFYLLLASIVLRTLSLSPSQYVYFYNRDFQFFH